jgi:hypothetical protein
VFAAIKAAKPTPELLAYQYLQTLPQMAQGEANKVWLVPSDFGKALEGFTRMLGAPGEDGVFRFEPSPIDDAVAASKPEDDDEQIKDWFDTAGDPALAKAVADAEAQARKEVPALGAPPAVRIPTPNPIPPHLPPPARPAQGNGPVRPGSADDGHGLPESALPTPPRGIPQDPGEGSQPRPARPGPTQA